MFKLQIHFVKTNIKQPAWICFLSKCTYTIRITLDNINKNSIIVGFIMISISFLYRWRSPFIRHDRLVEDSQVDSFYRITFPDKNSRDEPGLESNFDSGIENPSYDKMEEQILKR